MKITASFKHLGFDQSYKYEIKGNVISKLRNIFILWFSTRIDYKYYTKVLNHNEYINKIGNSIVFLHIHKGDYCIYSDDLILISKGYISPWHKLSKSSISKIKSDIREFRFKKIIDK